MDFSFCFTIVELIAVPATGFVDCFGHSRAVQVILIYKERFDKTCVLQHDLQFSTEG